MRVVLVHKTRTILPGLIISEAEIGDMKFMNTCSFTIDFKKFNVSFRCL